jgi:hypothetical protein
VAQVSPAKSKVTSHGLDGLARSTFSMERRSLIKVHAITTLPTVSIPLIRNIWNILKLKKPSRLRQAGGH